MGEKDFICGDGIKVFFKEMTRTIGIFTPFLKLILLQFELKSVEGGQQVYI